MQIKDANLDINYKDIELQCNLSKSRNGHKMEDQIKFCLDFLLLAVCFLRKLFCLETDLGGADTLPLLANMKQTQTFLLCCHIIESFYTQIETLN